MCGDAARWAASGRRYGCLPLCGYRRLVGTAEACLEPGGLERVVWSEPENKRKICPSPSLVSVYVHFQISKVSASLEMLVGSPRVARTHSAVVVPGLISEKADDET